MKNELDSITLPLRHMEDKGSIDKSKIQTSWNRFTNKLSRFSWILVLYQSLMGLLLLFVTIFRINPFFDYWIIGVMAFLFLSGSFYGWYIGNRTNINISESGAANFTMSGQWKKFLPIMILLFSTRIILMVIDQHVLADMKPFMRTLPLFIAGVLASRGITLFIRFYFLKKDYPQKGKNLT